MEHAVGIQRKRLPFIKTIRVNIESKNDLMHLMWI
jgi:hypothetical protein